MKFYSGGDGKIRYARVLVTEGAPWHDVTDASKNQPDPWVFEAPATPQDSNAVYPDDTYAVIFIGSTDGSGWGGSSSTWAVALSDIDLDCDSLNESNQPNRRPLRSREEDDAEYPRAGSSTNPRGMVLRPYDDWAELPVSFHMMKRGVLSLQVTKDEASRYIFGVVDSNTGQFVALAPNSGNTSLPGMVTVYRESDVEARADGNGHDDTINRLFGIRQSTAPFQADEDTATIAAVLSWADNPSPGDDDDHDRDTQHAIDKILVSRSPEDKDTNRDDLVDVGEDLQAFGADTGTISWQVERPQPQVYIPLGASQWNQLTVHAYLAQGAFQFQRNKYIAKTGVDPNGIWQAYSLHTRIDSVRMGKDASATGDANRNMKRVTVVRPRGNTVAFDFPWDPNGFFGPVGYPTGINNKRTYVLRDITPDSDTDRAFQLHFDSGIIHEFDAATGIITTVSHIDGRSVTVSSMAGMSGDTKSSDSNIATPRYKIVLHWNENKVLSSVAYTDLQTPSAGVTVTCALDSNDQTRIVGLSKDGDLSVFSASASGILFCCRKA